MKFTKQIAAAATTAALALTLAACGGDESGGKDDKIVIGIKYDQPGLVQKVGDKYEGFDVEVAKYVAKELGYEESKIEFKEAPSPQRENLIQGGQVKLVVATYSISEERKKKVTFAGPYIVVGQDLLVRKDSDITSVETLKGKKLCSVTGSTSAKNVKEKVPGVQLQEFDTYSKCADALANGAIDALTTDDIILAGYAAQDAYKGKLKLVGAPFTEEKLGIGMKKGDTKLCEDVNKAVQKMIDEGEWKKALEKTVGPSGYTIPEPPKFDGCN